MAEPMPRKNECERWNAFGGKLKACARLKCVRPAKMIHPIVPMTTAHIHLDRLPMLVMRR